MMKNPFFAYIASKFKATVSTFVGNIVVMQKTSMQTSPRQPKRKTKYTEYFGKN